MYSILQTIGGGDEGGGGWELGYVFKITCFSFLQIQIAKALDTDYGLKLQNVKVQKKFGIVDGNIKAHIKETATSQYNARMSTSKVAKFINRAGVAMAVVGAGE